MNISVEMKKKISISVRLILSFLFLFSAVAKLYPSPNFALTTFEFKQLVPLGFSDTAAAYFSRTLIGCELALGMLLLQSHYYKRLVLPMSFLILFIFSVHLSYGLIADGNDGNCGCFGALLPMTPLQALIKNIIAMAMIGYLFKTTNLTSDKTNFSFLSSVTSASILVIYLVGPMNKVQTAVVEMISTEVEVDQSKIVIPEKVNSTVIDKVDVVKNDAKTEPPLEVDEPKKVKSGYANFFPDIDQGKKVLCFFAPGCEHCQETAKELTQLKNQSSDFPDIKIVFMDEEAELIPAFFEKAGAKYPYQMADVLTFWKNLGSSRDTPGVFYLWNGNVIRSYDGITDKKFKMLELKTLVTREYKE